MIQDELHLAVKTMLDAEMEDYDAEQKRVYLRDLQQNGCESGMVTAVIYTSDCVEFFDEHKESINTMLAEAMRDGDYSSLSEMFGDKWYADDPLALTDENKNLLVWYVVETVANEMLEDTGADDEDA